MDWTPRFARARPGLNHVIAYGQSLSTGWEGFPALSTRPVPGAMMLGGSVRPASEFAPDWSPVGEPALRPLVATVQDIATGAVLPPAAAAALPAGALALGETVLEGALAEWRARAGAMQDIVFLASACGVGGRSLEALSKGASPELFNRLRGCVRAGRSAAEAAGLDYGIVALLFLQGEHNSWALNGTADRATYAALLRRFYADSVADAAAVVAGQSLPPAMFLYQTGGAYASTDNAVAQAQLDVALDTPLCFLAAPVYPVTDKGGHLDANGYRWLGAQFGKVMHRVLTLGEPWLPLHPVVACAAGASLRVTFHVPAPPLRWGRPFGGLARQDVPQRGFSLADAAGEIGIADVAIEPPDRLRFVLDRPAGQGAVLRYATARHGGLGALHDSDPHPSALFYEPESAGGRTSADVLALAGQPYPLYNWCVAFSIPIEPA
jgi:hypothetical protein